MFDKTKRYTFVIGTLGSGGAERVISILSDRMACLGGNVEIIQYYKYEVFYKINDLVKITVVEQETKTKNTLINFVWLRKYLLKNSDVVISFLASINMLVIGTTLGLGKTVIVADRNDPERVPECPFIRGLRNILYLFADGVIVQTKHNKEYFNHIIQKKCEIIFNPIDIDKINKIKQSSKENIIVSVGRLLPQKNQKLLIKAFSHFHKIFPQYMLTIYGEGKCREQLEVLSKELGIEKYISLPGNVENVLEEVSKAKMFVLSSDYEGMSNALIEALCLGIPTISTKVSGATDIIEHNVNGLLTECNDVYELKNAMIKMIEDAELRKKCEDYASSLKILLSPEKILKQWIEFINEISVNKK